MTSMDCQLRSYIIQIQTKLQGCERLFLLTYLYAMLYSIFFSLYACFSLFLQNSIIKVLIKQYAYKYISYICLLDSGFFFVRSKLF